MTKAVNNRAPRGAHQPAQVCLMDPMHDETPHWVVEMHKHYCEHGYYRATDVQRGLGQPTRSVGRALTLEPLVNMRAD